MPRRSRRSSKSRSGLKRVLQVVGLLVMVAGVFATVKFLGRMGPGAPEASRTITRLPENERQAALEESKRLEEAFRETLKVKNPNEEEMAMIDRAILLHKQFMNSGDEVDAPQELRLKELETLQETAVTRPLAAEAEQARQIADDPNRATEERLAAYQTTIRNLERIATIYPQSESRKPHLLQRLIQDQAQLAALPIQKQLEAIDAQLGTAMEAEDWDEAKKLLREAISLQRTLNAEHRGSRYSSLRRLSSYETRLESLRATPDFERMQSLQQEAEAALAAEAYRDAADFFQRAGVVQQRINEEYDRSQFASEERLEELQNRYQSALATEIGLEILAGVAQLDRYLRERNTRAAQELIARLNQKAKQYANTYPHSDVVDAETFRKLSFLDQARDRLPALQKRLHDSVVALPDADGIEMMTTEVPQILFEQVMFSNPSRRKGSMLPVESINFAETQEFATKAGWILGRPARLPTTEEFKSALGSVRYADLGETTWNAENSGGDLHAVGSTSANALGFHDLLGNAAEFLQSGEGLGQGEAYLAGGSALDPVDTIVEVPMRIVSRSSRHRSGGFRIVVLADE